MSQYTDDQLDVEVLYVLKQHRGKQNPIGRWEMVTRIFGAEACEPRGDNNPADRQIRYSVGRLRKRGALICDMGDGLGRFMAETLDEFEDFDAKFGARAYDVLETLDAMRKSAQREFPAQRRLL